MKKTILLALCAALCLAGCGGSKKQYATLEGFALGTTYRIIVGGIDDTTGMHAKLNSLFGEVTASMSIYAPNSLLNRINRNETDSVDHHIAYCVELARRFSVASDGAYDITIKPLTDAWGFGAQGQQERPNVEYILQYVGYEKIRIADGRLIKDDPRTQIDLNSVAKGYTVDLTGQLLESLGAIDYLVEIGGEIYCRGVNRTGGDWIVGVDKPIDNNLTPGRDEQARLPLTERGLATSGNYRRFYVDAAGNKVTHTINAVTGAPAPSNMLSATVVAENCATADAAATMMMAIGLERSAAFLDAAPDLDGYLIYSGENGQMLTYTSPGMKKLMTKKQE